MLCGISRISATRCSTNYWSRAGVRGQGSGSDRLVLVDQGESYQVTLPTADADPQTMDLEVSDHSLRLRTRSWSGLAQNTCHFPHPIDSERVTASWRDGVLQVTLPKKRGRRIVVE